MMMTQIYQTKVQLMAKKEKKEKKEEKKYSIG